MKSPVYCDGCGDVEVGTYITYAETFNGQDPPETEYDSNAHFVPGRSWVYCDSCWENYLEERDDEDIE